MRRRGRSALWIAFVASILAIGVVVGFPTLYIHPFKPQTGRGMTVAFALRQAAPLATFVCLVVAGAAGVWLCVTTRRWWTRLAVALLLAIATVPTWFVRQNHFEWMFAPLPSVEYVAVADADFLTDNEIVIGVQLGNTAHAYPIRQLGYHHVVNTEVGGKPVVATY